VEVKRIAGAHYSFLEKPYVAVLAAKLKESLERAQEEALLGRATGQDHLLLKDGTEDRIHVIIRP
jgi:hypothetical protein